jgi:hypothetical protein
VRVRHLVAPEVPLATEPLQGGPNPAYASNMRGTASTISAVGFPSGVPASGGPGSGLAASGEVGASVRGGALGAAPAASEAFPERAPLTRTELALILGFWTLIGILTTANRMIEPQALRGPWQPIIPIAPVLLGFATAYLWAVLTVPIFRLTSRFTIERSGWLLRIMYVVLGLLIAIGVDIADSFFRHILYYSPTPLSPEQVALARLRDLWFINEFLVYAAVLAAGFARNYFLNYRVRREEAVNLKAQAAQLQA